MVKKQNHVLPFLAVVGVVVIVALFILVLNTKADTKREISDAVAGQASLPGTSTQLLADGDRCRSNTECHSGACGLDRTGSRICVRVRTDRNGEVCSSYAECVSGYCPIPTKGTAICVACSADSQCQLGEVCGIDNTGARVCTVLDSDGPGSRCLVDDECNTGLCGINNSGTRVCTNPRSDLNSSRCVNGNECVSGYCPTPTSGNQICRSCSLNNQCGVGQLCGLDNSGVRACTTLGSDPLNANCAVSQECASGVCNQAVSTLSNTRSLCVECNVTAYVEYITPSPPSGINQCSGNPQGNICSPVNGGACINPWTNLKGASCNYDNECASGSCFIHYGLGTCDPFGTAPLGVSCSYNSDCASGLCGFESVGNSVCTTPFSEPPLSSCNSDRECQSHLCEGSQCTE